MYSQQGYGERCCNYPWERASRERCSQCKYAQQVLRTFSQCQVDWDEIQKNKKIMEEAREKVKAQYGKWVSMANGTYVNGVKVWDKRWYVNIFCKINWFLHFRMHKRLRSYINSKVKLGKASHFAQFTMELNNDND